MGRPGEYIARELAQDQNMANLKAFSERLASTEAMLRPCERCAKDVYEIYKVDNPVEALGMPMSHKWAVSKNGDFVDSFKLKREAKACVEAASDS